MEWGTGLTAAVKTGTIEQTARDKKKQKALRYILEAWEEAEGEGIEAEVIATAAIFAALAELVTIHGEDVVARMTKDLPQRIAIGEFSIGRTLQ